MFRCRYCGCEPQLVPGYKAYGGHFYTKNDTLFWKCPFCDAMVGCHPGTTKPLGDLADKETRILRIELHRVLDPIWRNKWMTREQTYNWLAKQLNISYKSCHVSQLSNENLKKAKTICEAYLVSSKG